MNKLLLGIMVLTACGVANADRVQCPKSLNCATIQGRVTCTNLPNDWEIITSPQPSSSNYANYTVIAPRYDSQNIMFNNVQCVYNNSLSIDRTQTAAPLYPDTSDAWGWTWNETYKATAQCVNYAACPMNTLSP